MNLTFSFDIGVASCGWAVINKDTYEIIECGSNLFTEAAANQNVERRNFRQLRRLHRRHRVRINDYKKLWANKVGDIPTILCNNQLELRNKGLTDKLTKDELYFTLLNLLQHRGISYLDDLDDAKNGGNDYQKGLKINAEELKNSYPCQIQLKRLEKFGEFRGNIKDDSGEEKITLSNVFTTSAYRKEIEALLDKQKEYHDFLTEEFVNEYLKIFDRKRKYYEGPGNEQSRTDYGKYTTVIGDDGEYITEKNIFNKLIGMCSIYKDEQRGAGASYTAQEFNALNDLNNLTVNNRKLTKEEKEKIIDSYKNEKSVSMKAKKVRAIISKVIGEDIDSFKGARINKKEEEIFHTFETYRYMRDKFAEIDVDIEDFDRDTLDDIARVLTLNTERESIEEGFIDAGLNLDDKVISKLIEIRKNSSHFGKWQSFSIRLMKELIPEMYETSNEQMTLLYNMGYIGTDTEKYKDYNKIPTKDLMDKMYNPVVRKSVHITIEILNALLKKYGNPDQIVIEMPRDRNLDDEKKRINEIQTKNEKELKEIIKKIESEYGRKVTDKDFRKQKGLVLRLKLWNEQNGMCLYSGKDIDINDLIDKPRLFEVDHAIPFSISFDDSRNNKVLVYSTENQDKGNKTPYYYLKDLSREADFNQYKARVMSLKYSKKKRENLLNTDDIRKEDVVQGFISRNINDTRYASRVVLNTVQEFFKANNASTKIKVVKGGLTHQIRQKLNLNKDRDESYAHHAEDAAIIAYSQMGFDYYRAELLDVIDFETGEILKQELVDKVMSDDYCADMIYANKLKTIKDEILRVKDKVKYWHKIDKKPNRGICKQTIWGTRTIDDKVYQIGKIDIRNKDDIKKLINDIQSGEDDCYLMKKNDLKTYEILKQILVTYRDQENPILAYEKDNRDVFRKYSKKGNGPRIDRLKYIVREAKSCIDISHKYGFERNKKKVILLGVNPFRTDVYFNKKKGNYRLIGIKYSDLKFEKGKIAIDIDKYNNELIREKLLESGQTMENLHDNGFEFVMSFYKDEIIRYEKDGEMMEERFLSRIKQQDSKNQIETKPIDAPSFKKRNQITLTKTKSIVKIRTDILGNKYICTKEKFSLEI